MSLSILHDFFQFQNFGCVSFPILFSCCYWKKKNWSWWFSISLWISFHSLEKTSSSKSWWNQDSYWPLRRKFRGQGLPCVYRRAPQKILSYNSEDYTSRFFSSLLLGWPKVSSSFHVILYWKTWMNFWVNPIYPTSPFWSRSALGFLWKEWC